MRETKNTYVTVLGKKKRKGCIKLGFDYTAGMRSEKDVVTYLDQEQQEWEKENPTLVPTEVRDELIHFRPLAIAQKFWCGFRYFFPVLRNSDTTTI